MNELLDLFESLIAQAGQIYDELSDAEREQVLATFQEILQLIQQQHARQAAPAPPEQPPPGAEGVEPAPMNSSNIWGFSYDPEGQVLRVRFQGDGIYQYQGVPPYIFRIFQAGAVPARTTGRNSYGRWWVGKVPSLGAAFYELIRNGGYGYQRVA